MIKRIAVLALIAGLAGCATSSFEVVTPFDVNEVAYINERGSATVTGQAFLRQRGGGVVTCAGTEVVLIPAGKYAIEWAYKSFGSTAGGYMDILTLKQFQNADPRFKSYSRTTICDAEGDFEFRGVANGSYYVKSTVSWYAGRYVYEGGTILKRIWISGGHSQRVLLSY